MADENVFEGLGNMLQTAMAGAQTSGDAKEWWHTFRYPETPDFSVDKLMNCARSALFGAALGGSQAVREGTWSRAKAVKSKQVALSIQNYVNNLAGRLVYNLSTIKEINTHIHNVTELFFVFSGGAISATIIQTGNDFVQHTDLQVNVVGTTKAHMQLGKDILETCLEGKDVPLATK